MAQRLSDTDWAYLAGFVDGDGCIGTVEWRQKSTKKGRGRWGTFLTISQRDQVSLFELYKLFNEAGCFYIYKKSGVARWRIDNARDLRWILGGLIPHLRLKRGQAEGALRVLDDRTDRASVIEIKALKAHRAIDKEGE